MIVAIVVLASLLGTAIAWAAFYYGDRRGARMVGAEMQKLRTIIEQEGEDYLQLWLTRAAETTPYDAIKAHVQKHARELDTDVETQDDRLAWSASMHNLLAIYDAVAKVAPGTEDRLERMMKKFASEGQLTPAPILLLKKPKPAPKRETREIRFGIYNDGIS